jgi:hypothetical protein
LDLNANEGNRPPEFIYISSFSKFFNPVTKYSLPINSFASETKIAEKENVWIMDKP